METAEATRLINEIINESEGWLKKPDDKAYPFDDLKLMSGTLSFGTDAQKATEALSRIDRIVEFLQGQGKSGLANQIEKKVEKIKNEREAADRLTHQLADLGSYKPSQYRSCRELKQAVREIIGTLQNTISMFNDTPVAKESPGSSDVNKNRIEWDAKDHNYYPNKEAIKEANKIGQEHDINELKQLDYDALRKLLRLPNCMIKYMSRRTPPRGRVHKQDWRKYLRTQINQAERIENVIEQQVIKRLQ